MNTLLKNRILSVDKRLDELRNQKELHENTLRLTEEHIKAIQMSQESFIQEKQALIDQNNVTVIAAKTRMDDIKEEIDTLNTLTVNNEKLYRRRRKVEELLSSIKHKSHQVNKEIDFFSENETCPTCEQIISKMSKAISLKKRNINKSEFDEAIKHLNKEHDTIQEDLNRIVKVLDHMNELNIEFKTMSIRVVLSNKNIIELKEEIEEIKSKTEVVDISKLDDVKQKLLLIRNELDECTNDRTTMGYATTLLKDSGIKAKIIKTFIPVINQLINKYLASLDFFVEFTLNESFEEKILSRFRDDFIYESFSEGEKMRLNIAILFAWRALAKLRGSIDCNLVVLDELLDSSLDDDGLDDVLKLLASLNNGENVFVISHKKDQLIDKFSRCIQFEKVRNFARIAA